MDFSVTFFACIWSHVCWCTLEILTDLPGEKCTSFAEMWRGCGTATGVRKSSLETLISDSLSPAAPLGTVLLHDCWDVWLGQHHPLSGKSCQWCGLGTKQCVGFSSVCCSLWQDRQVSWQSLKWTNWCFSKLFCLGKAINILAQIRANYQEMVNPACLEDFKSRTDRFLDVS